MILTHGANSLSRGSGDPDVIGGRKYRTVTIGEQTWLAENLDYKFDGLIIGSGPAENNTELRANYYNNDETAYGANGLNIGLLYNWYAVKYLNDNRDTLMPGWHVPTSEEWNELVVFVGGQETAGTKLKSTTRWNNSDNCTDDYGFTAYPSGYYLNSLFSNVNTDACYWTITSTSNPAYAYYKYILDDHSFVGYSSYLKPFQYALRLVKDA